MIESQHVLKAPASCIRTICPNAYGFYSGYNAAKHAPIASWGVPYDWLIKEEKLVYYVSASHAGTTHK